MADYDIGNGIADAEEVTPDLPTTVARLAAMNPLEYEKCRKNEAKSLGIDRVKVLDDAVELARKDTNFDNAKSGIIFDDPAPWPDPIDGDDLLDAIVVAARRYLVLPPGVAEAIALWILHAHAVNAFYHTPRLAVTAPERGCGKSVVLDFLALLTPRCLQTENVSTAVVFRLTEDYQPTLLCDEVDTYLKSRDELVGILNAGHKRGAKAFRCNGDDNQVKSFSAFAPVATAGIGKLPPTLGDRSIPVRMRRASNNERPVPLRADRAHHERNLMRQCIRWKLDNFDALMNADPSVPDWMFNRVADNWRPLFAIADAAGGEWPERARSIAAVLSNETVSEETYRLMALKDLETLFREQEADYLLSEKIVEAFRLIETRPWADWKGKNGFTANQLSRLLGEFDLRPKAIKAAGSRRGYRFDDCEPVFSAYLAVQSATPLPATESGAFSDIQTATNGEAVALCNPRKPAENLEGSGVAVWNGNTGDDDDIEREALMNEEFYPD